MIKAGIYVQEIRKCFVSAQNSLSTSNVDGAPDFVTC